MSSNYNFDPLSGVAPVKFIVIKVISRDKFIL